MTSEAQFEVSESERPGVPVLHVRGEIDVASAPEFHASLSDVIGQGSKVVIVDTSGVTFIDSTGLGVLVGAEKLIREAGNDLRLVVTQPQITRLLELTGLDEVFTVVSSTTDSGDGMTSAMSAPDMVGTDSLHRVELSLAADAEMLFLARMTGAAVASRADFAYEQVEDLRLALDELCVRLIGQGSGAARLTLAFQWDEAAVEVMASLVPQEGPSTNGSHEGSHEGGVPGSVSAELSERILEALVDEHGGDTVGDVHRAWLRMRRQA